MCPAQIGRVGKLLPSARKSASANLKAEDRRRVGITDPGGHDGAGGPWRSHPHDANAVTQVDVVIEVQADLVDLERLAPVDIG